jgi:LPXTG-site transpeptidase (sortase) family protein
LTAPIKLQTGRSSEINRVIVSGISLDEPVVMARLIDEGGRSTWEIPAFAVGHAEGTPGSGEPGNVVLLGHVESREAGNVFKELHRVREDDVVELWSGDRVSSYRVISVRNVRRDDPSVLQSTGEPSVTLITCGGWWNPFLRDYSERLVVQGSLVIQDTASDAS